MKFMVYILMAAVLGLSVTVGYTFEQISSGRSDARARQTHAWHTVVCQIESATIATKTIPTSKKRFVVKFYDNLLISIQVPPCGLAAKIPK